MNFNQVLNNILKEEGGWYDGSNPRDPNPTMKGITQSVYDSYRKDKPHISVKNITDWELVDIYYKNYWTDGRCYLLPDGVDLVHFDFCVNAGITQATKILQRVLNVNDDGIFGPQTMRAAQNAYATFTIKSYSEARRDFYKRLSISKPNLAPNLKGWLRRTDRIESAAYTAASHY
jgi:lysozyme family protein